VAAQVEPGLESEKGVAEGSLNGRLQKRGKDEVWGADEELITRLCWRGSRSRSIY
jgi:hypothetical protein